MTALKKYLRLEALGLWREGAGAEPREVIVAFGDSTVVLRDLADRPLGHWALAGMQPTGRQDGATLYALTLEGDETLAIRDPEMIAAIAAVARDIRRPPSVAPRPRRRFPFGGLAVAALLLAAALYGPGLIRAQAARMVPPEQAAEFGDRMLLQLLEWRGPLCTDPAGQRALGRLAARLAGGVPLRVLALGSAPVVVLPGPSVLIDRGALARAGGPDEVALRVAAALGPDPASAALTRLMRAAGPFASLAYVFTGRLGDAALARAAAAALEPLPIDGLPAPPPSPLLSDRDWVALQGICG